MLRTTSLRAGQDVFWFNDNFNTIQKAKIEEVHNNSVHLVIFSANGGYSRAVKVTKVNAHKFFTSKNEAYDYCIERLNKNNKLYQSIIDSNNNKIESMKKELSDEHKPV